MSFTVYILFSKEFNKHYTGFTSNLEERLLSHNKLGNGWTKRYRPWTLIYTRNFLLKSDAMNFEKSLESGVGREFIKTINQ